MQPPFYFIVTFWGEKFTQMFMEVCAASLLSPNNIPSLKYDKRSKFLIVTTKKDWLFFKKTDRFESLKNTSQLNLLN